MKLSKEHYQFWKANSYLIFPGLYTNLSHEIDKWVDEIAHWPLDMSKWLSFFEMEDPQKLSRIENFIPYHAKLAQVINGFKVMTIVDQLMGEPAILYKERINFKPPGGGAHAAHQDGVAYESGTLKQFNPRSIPYISILISVDAATAENGCLEVVKDWPLNKLDILPMERPLPNAPNFSKIKQEVEDDLPWIHLQTEPGDVVFFTERLPHRSKPNLTTESRRILYGVYNPLKEGDRRAKYFADKRKNINDARYMVGNPHAPTPLEFG